MNRTSIEWTHRPETGGAAGGFTWNPIIASIQCQACGHHHKSRRACGQPVTRHGAPDTCHCPVGAHTIGTFCTRISPGCTHCYASAINKRFGNGLEFTVLNLEKVEFFIDEKILEEPLRRKKPATIFMGDMFDLFHEAIPRELIHRVWDVIGACPQHTFQVLTKRAQRMWELMHQTPMFRWAYPNIWLGVSIESQKYADERIPLLLQTPAAVRFLSVEPMLEAVDLCGKDAQGSALDQYAEIHDGLTYNDPKIDWVICGGESGPGARPFNLAWAESLLEQCRAAGVAFFMKQMGSNPYRAISHETADPKTWFAATRFGSKGGDIELFPEHLRVRQFPSEKLVTA